MRMASAWPAGFLAALVVLCASHAGAAEIATSIDAALAGTHRSAQNRARDSARNPRETLMFFGLRADQHVVEVWPGGGWYTEVLAPVLRDRGRLYAAHYHVDDATHRYYRNARQQFLDKIAKRPEVYDRVAVTAILPPHVSMAPAGSVDLVLTFRNVHNWFEPGYEGVMFKAFYDALKSGGTLGVVEHRAKEGTSRSAMIRSGYVTESYVIELATKAGFRLDARSDINANPRDTKDHPRGVWTLPPTLRMGDQDREKYVAIGESDRMTLRFVKP